MKCAKYQQFRMNRDEQIKAHLMELDTTDVEIRRYRRKNGRRDRHG